MNINMITIIGILVVAICSFGFLADMMLANWRALGRTKTDSFSKPNKRVLSHRLKPSLDCFEACMNELAWDVDETSLCASKCRA
jgi:hypothetical protein